MGNLFLTFGMKNFINLILGVALSITFIWLFVKGINRTSILHSLLRINTIGGIAAGLYLVFTSSHSLLF